MKRISHFVEIKKKLSTKGKRALIVPVVGLYFDTGNFKNVSNFMTKEISINLKYCLLLNYLFLKSKYINFLLQFLIN